MAQLVARLVRIEEVRGSNPLRSTISIASESRYTSPLFPMHVNVGRLVESALRANDQLDWVITSKKDAIAGTESGDYYAASASPRASRCWRRPS